MMATGCEVAHRRKSLLAHQRKRVRWNRSARSVVNAPVNEMVVFAG
jgi:hypothetical protein